MSDEFERALMNLRNDTASFRDFVRDTTHVWQRFAVYLCKRWKPPLGVDEDDVRQELIAAAWRFVHEWEPERGVSISRYVRYNALDKGKKFLLRQRNTCRRDGSAPARVPVAFTCLERSDDEPGSAQERLTRVEPDTVETALTERDRRRQIDRALEHVAYLFTPLEHDCLAHLIRSGGSLDETADRILNDPQLCQALRVGTEDAALEAARTILTKVLDVITPEETPCH